MTMTCDRHRSACDRRIETAPSHATRCGGGRRRSRTQMPDYTWVGIYLLDGDELVLGPFLGKPSPHTRIPLEPGHLRRRREHKADDRRRRRRRRSAVSRVQPRNAIGDRRADHARHRGARRDRHRQRQARRRSARPIASCSRRWPALLARKFSHAMTAHDITLIPGDGIGPEVTRAVLRVLDGVGLRSRMGGVHAPAPRRSRSTARRCRRRSSTRSARTRSRSRDRSRRRSARGSPA